jgi:uncharacterized coiled-coil protein SlyX
MPEEHEEEYELVPLSPLRRIERRIERLEKTSVSQELNRELLEIVRANQQVVDDLVRTNSEMISRVAELSTAVNNLIAKIGDFISRIEIEEAPIESSSVREVEQKLNERLDKLEKRINALILTTAARKRPVPPPA